MCPCNEARWGAALLTWCLYTAAWSQAFVGQSLAALIARAGRGDISVEMGAWAAVAALGRYWLLSGLREAQSHADEFRLGSFVWSVGVIALVGHVLMSRTGPVQPDGVRAFLFAWVGGNIVNIWLQLRGVVGRRVPVEPVAAEAPLSLRQRTLRRFRLSSRSGDAEWDEATEWYGNDHHSAPPPQFFPAPPHIAPVIEHDRAAPQIGYLDGNGNFIPVQLPPGQKVPVNRRLR
jgi:hypothetical protein